MYATRSQFVHVDFATMIQNGQFDDLKDHLYRDLCDIAKVILPQDEHHAYLLTKVAEQMIQHWYTRDEEFPANVQLWTPTNALSTAFKDMNRDPNANKEEHFKVAMEGITRDLAKTLNAANKEASLAQLRAHRNRKSSPKQGHPDEGTKSRFNLQ